MKKLKKGGSIIYLVALAIATFPFMAVGWMLYEVSYAVRWGWDVADHWNKVLMEKVYEQ